jgi:hypothetical protein
MAQALKDGLQALARWCDDNLPEIPAKVIDEPRGWRSGYSPETLVCGHYPAQREYPVDFGPALSGSGGSTL